MDAETQKEIRLQAIIKATGITLKEATSGLQSNADKAEALAAKWDNLKLKIGGVFTSIMGGIASGIGALIDELSPKDTVEEWRKLQTSVNDAERTLPKLIKRFDELKEKTKLSNKEHSEFNTILSTIQTMFPEAITGWDNYGNAIAFSKDKLKELIAAQKEEMKLSYSEAQKSLLDKAAALQKQMKTDEAILTKGTKIVTTPSFGGAYTASVVKLTAKEVDELNKKIRQTGKEIESTEKKLTDIINQSLGLSTEPPPPKNTGGGKTDDAKKKQEEDAKKRAEDYKKQVEETTKLYDGLVGITTGYIEKLKELYNLELIEAEKKFGKDKEAFEKWKANAQKELNEKIALKQREQDILNNPAMLKAKGLEGGLKKSTPKELEKESTPTNEIEKKSYEDLQKESDKATKANESFATSMSSAFSQAFISGQNLGDVFKNIALQLAGMVIQALAFKAIMSVLDIGTGGFFGALFGAQGGTFQNGQKVASFAGGGSFIVPPGYDHDSFRMNVQSGERVQVTPANAVKNDKDYAKNINASLSQIAGNIRAINFNNMERGVYESNKDVVLRVNDREIARASLGGQNDYTKKGKNVGDFRSL
jgi:thiol-disulfide isomerase/thioredoxin